MLDFLKQKKTTWNQCFFRQHEVIHRKQHGGQLFCFFSKRRTDFVWQTLANNIFYITLWHIFCSFDSALGSHVTQSSLRMLTQNTLPKIDGTFSASPCQECANGLLVEQHMSQLERVAWRRLERNCQCEKGWSWKPEVLNGYLEDGLPGLGYVVIGSSPFISHEWPFGRRTTLLRGLINHLLDKWDGPPSIYPPTYHPLTGGTLVPARVSVRMSGVRSLGSFPVKLKISVSPKKFDHRPAAHWNN